MMLTKSASCCFPRARNLSCVSSVGVRNRGQPTHKVTNACFARVAPSSVREKGRHARDFNGGQRSGGSALVAERVGSTPTPSSFNEMTYWNAHAYGRALRISRRSLLGGLAILCILIPFIAPLWIVPVAAKYMPLQVVWRYE